MCKWNKYGDTRIDPCMKKFVDNFKHYCSRDVIILACCCGHGRYPITVVVKDIDEYIFELFSGEEIPRSRRFYKRDAQGHYYIPEVSEIRKEKL